MGKTIEPYTHISGHQTTVVYHFGHDVKVQRNCVAVAFGCVEYYEIVVSARGHSKIVEPTNPAASTLEHCDKVRSIRHTRSTQQTETHIPKAYGGCHSF